MSDWFTASKEGLKQLVAGLPRSFVLYELLSNCFDEDGVRSVQIYLEPVPGRSLATLSVADDSSTGFRRLSDAWTLFAPSYKKGNAEQRGRYNMGEKTVFALAEEGTISTTTGTVTFGATGRHHTSRKRREQGSQVTMTLKVTRAELAEMKAGLDMIIVPDHVEVVFNRGTSEFQILKAPTPIEEFETSLPTVLADAEGNLTRKTIRKTTVRVYEPLTDDGGWLYEMGIPVVRTGDLWSVYIWSEGSTEHEP